MKLQTKKDMFTQEKTFLNFLKLEMPENLHSRKPWTLVK